MISVFLSASRRKLAFSTQPLLISRSAEGGFQRRSSHFPSEIANKKKKGEAEAFFFLSLICHSCQTSFVAVKREIIRQQLALGRKYSFLPYNFPARGAGWPSLENEIQTNKKNCKKMDKYNIQFFPMRLYI